MKKLLAGLLLLILLFVAAGAAGTFIAVPFNEPPAPVSRAEPKPREILILSNPIHTDIALRLDAETLAQFGFLEDAGVQLHHPDAQWLIFGWGGRSFYMETPTWADLKPMPLFKGLTIDHSVMHVDLAGAIDVTQPWVTPLTIDDAQLHSMMDFIAGSFIRTDNQVASIGSYGAFDHFFEAKGRFNALFGCNTWTAQALRTGGLRTGLWNPIPQSLALSLKLFNPENTFQSP
ncbi:TIGR02117 family protein [Tianweitania sp. BSSL-BM11]|uniref:TIGR02117 family protein n=1 Tax=Tianweitania aestuarii TaxID=2814886 RepID=A0ABS5RXX1_9HYPH|nr:TIGR02117 family protein [Tianweitania aestuarii]MBS9721896.1 TIGR02117 family protein [Tianweitania aestuarii]